MDRPDVVLVAIPLFVVSGYALSAISQFAGAANGLAVAVEGPGYLAALASIYWTVSPGAGAEGD